MSPNQPLHACSMQCLRWLAYGGSLSHLWQKGRLAASAELEPPAAKTALSAIRLILFAAQALA